MLMKFPFISQYHLLEKLSMWYRFAEGILEAANLCCMMSGMCFVMFRRYFLYTNLIYSTPYFGMTAHVFCVLLGTY